jgi:hypothetical protein
MKSELEMQADQILAQDLKNKKRNKSRSLEYSFLSDSQLARRRSKEIPFSSLSRKQSEQATNPDEAE